MEDFELLLEDRLQVIRELNKQYDLENNAYLSFSGGKDSTVLHHLLDLALPNNKIPRVFINTGIEYLMLVKHIYKLAETDDRITIIQPTQHITKMLEKYGYPFKSKTHAHYVSTYQKSGKTQSIEKYLDWEPDNFYKCPKKLQYQFSEDFKIPISDRCCLKLKKEPGKKWGKEHNRPITITGIRKSEGGARASKGCIIKNKEGELKKFHPLFVVNDKFIEWFINKYNVKLCELYYEPYNFNRIGCKGCPFNRRLDDELKVLEDKLPNDRKHCEMIWKPVYDEYRRLGYRLNVKYKK